MESEIVYILKKIELLACFILIFLISNGQSSSNGLFINLKLNHFIAKNRHGYFIPISPSVEMLYKQKLNRKISFLSGVNYSFSIWKDVVGVSSKFRRKEHEMAIPFLIERSLGDKVYMTLGSYMGWMISGIEENSNKFNTNWINITKYTIYNESSKFTCDLYIDVGLYQKITSKNSIFFSPFVTFNIKDNWMEERRANTCFGINIKLFWDF
jgi:hypothetical protein